MSSFLSRLRSAASLCALAALLNSEVKIGVSAERLFPGQQAPAPTAPQSEPSGAQATPIAPGEDQSTTVVQVTVPKPGALNISVVEGEGASNVLGKKRVAKPLVQVLDDKSQPVEGAVVTFIAPPDGPSLVFTNGLRTITVMTDGRGKARSPSMRAVNAGSFKLQVSAAFGGQLANATISQTNFETAAEASGEKPAPDKADTASGPRSNRSNGLSGKTLAVLIGVGAAAAVGIGVGLGGKGSGSSSTSTSTTATIGGPGTPTVTGPH